MRGMKANGKRQCQKSGKGIPLGANKAATCGCRFAPRTLLLKLLLWARALPAKKAARYIVRTRCALRGQSPLLQKQGAAGTRNNKGPEGPLLYFAW